MNFNYFIALIQRLSERGSSFNLTACRDWRNSTKSYKKEKEELGMEKEGSGERV